MTKKVRPDDCEPSGSAVDVGDALDVAINNVWGLIACLQTILTEHDGDPYIKGAIQLANTHLDELSSIRRDVTLLD